MFHLVTDIHKHKGIIMIEALLAAILITLLDWWEPLGNIVLYIIGGILSW